MLASLRANRPLTHILSTQLQLEVEHEHLMTRQQEQILKPLDNLIVEQNKGMNDKLNILTTIAAYTKLTCFNL
jgi:hypothetical protein